MIEISKKEFESLQSISDDEIYVKILNDKQIIKRVSNIADYLPNTSFKNSHLISIENAGILNWDDKIYYFIIMPYLSSYKNLSEIEFKDDNMFEYLNLYKRFLQTLKEIFKERYIYFDINSRNLLVDQKFNYMFVDPKVYPATFNNLPFLNNAKLKILGMLFNTYYNHSFSFNYYRDFNNLVKKVLLDKEVNNIFGNISSELLINHDNFFEREISELIKYEKNKNH